MAKKSQVILRYGVIVALVILVLFAGYSAYLSQKEKRDFAQTEQKIQALAVEIENLVGKPDQTNTEKSCGRAHLKFARGPLKCNITYSASYGESGL